MNGCRAIYEPDRDDLILLLSISCTKGCLMFIGFPHSDKMISVFQGELHKNLCASNTVMEFVNQRSRVFIHYRQPVKVSIVYA